MDDKVMVQILEELREIKHDLRWFKEREELKHQALLPKEPELDTPTRARALAAFVQKTKNK